MQIDYSKLCADHLRAYVQKTYSNKLKASHARELVAAFFGYKSHASLLCDEQFPLAKLAEAAILIPDVPLITQRLNQLDGLPVDTSWSVEMAQTLADFLTTSTVTAGTLFGGDIWVYENLEGYLGDVWLRENDAVLMDELSGQMAETNAVFTDLADFEGLEQLDQGKALLVTVHGRYLGDHLDEKPYCGHEISFAARLSFPRVASRRGFDDCDLDVVGMVNRQR